MPSGTADSTKTSIDTSSNAFSRKIVAERDVYPLLKVVIGSAVCINVTITSIVPTPFLKPRECMLI